MQAQRLSPARLRDRDLTRLLIRVFGGSTTSRVQVRVSEAERLTVVPLVFGLIPRDALHRVRPDQRIKPIIRAHLSTLSVDYDEELVHLIKRVSDQYYDSAVRRDPSVRRRKMGIEGVRALRRGIYEGLVARQMGRCAVCGVRFGKNAVETLDHILPWCLAGDPYDGSNWQLLCERCNQGKREWLSAFPVSSGAELDLWFAR